MTRRLNRPYLQMVQLFCTGGSKQSFENLVNVLNNFGNISGLKLNQIKIAG